MVEWFGVVSWAWSEVGVRMQSLGRVGLEAKPAGCLWLEGWTDRLPVLQR